jgi:chromosome partitioning protein
MSIIAVNNQKGGVGKTTITFNLSKGLAERGYKVLAVDNDPQGNLTSAFLEDPTQLKADILDIYQNNNHVEPEKIDDNLYLIGSTIHLAKTSDSDFDIIFRLKEGIGDLNKNFDFIFIDCLPSFGYLNMAALNASDYVLIPVKPAPFALAGIKDLFDTIDKAKNRLNQRLKVFGIIVNLVEGRKTTIGDELERVLRETYKGLVLETRISKGVKLEESPAFGQSIMEYDPKGKQTTQFNKLLDEFVDRYERQKK